MIIRIDDYPCGVRGRFHNDTKYFCEIMKVFDEYDLSYIVGVVPMGLTSRDAYLLNNLKGCCVAMHGVYHERSEIDGHPYELVDRQDLLEGINRLEELEIYLRPGRMYIPPFNNVTQEIVNLIDVLGFTAITTGTLRDIKINYLGLDVYTPKIHFYGRSNEIVPFVTEKNWGPREHVALHITWEHDVYRVNPSSIRHLAAAIADVAL